MHVFSLRLIVHRYMGSLKTKKLEALYSAAIMSDLEAAQIDNLQRVLGIKDGAADRIAQAAMTKNMMEMMEGMDDGEGLGDMEGLGAGGSPADTQQMIDVLKEVRKSRVLICLALYFSLLNQLASCFVVVNDSPGLGGLRGGSRCRTQGARIDFRSFWHGYQRDDWGHGGAS